MLLFLLALEVGVFLILIPWSSLWSQQFLQGSLEPLGPTLRNHYVRGGISALGLINVWVALAEATTLLRMRRPSQSEISQESSTDIP